MGLRVAPPTHGAGIYGDGSDGDVTLSANVTITRDMFYRNLIIPAGFTLFTSGFRVFWSESAVIDGTVDNSGANGSNGTANGGGGAGSGPAAGTLASGGTGGSSSNGNGNPGTSKPGCLSQSAGTGGNGNTTTGGVGGTATAPLAARGTVRGLPQAVLGATIGGNQLELLNGGPGGGGGGGNGVLQTERGGGGGGGGGPLVGAGRRLSGSGKFRSRGGNGGDAYQGGGTGMGGGGGGSGGPVLIVADWCEDRWADPTSSAYDVTGGLGGAKHGTGTNGAPGGLGAVRALIASRL